MNVHEIFPQNSINYDNSTSVLIIQTRVDRGICKAPSKLLPRVPRPPNLSVHPPQTRTPTRALNSKPGEKHSSGTCFVRSCQPLPDRFVRGAVGPWQIPAIAASSTRRRVCTHRASHGRIRYARQRKQDTWRVIGTAAAALPASRQNYDPVRFAPAARAVIA